MGSKLPLVAGAAAIAYLVLKGKLPKIDNPDAKDPGPTKGTLGGANLTIQVVP